MNGIEIRPEELQKKLAAGERVYLLDVRREWEHQTARIAGDVLIPLHEIPARLDEIDPQGALLVTYCHTGMRSLNAAAFLREHGFPEALSLAGGIDRWSLTIDPKVPRY
jgi:rhodanese-related sulfurtransferase